VKTVNAVGVKQKLLEEGNRESEYFCLSDVDKCRRKKLYGQ